MASHYEYKTEFARTHVAQGKALAMAGATLKLLEKRGISASEEARERIVACTDLDQLQIWFDRAFTVIAADELFD